MKTHTFPEKRFPAVALTLLLTACILIGYTGSADAATASINLSDKILYLNDSSDKTVNLKVINSSEKVEWSSSSAAVAAVKSTGKASCKVTAVKSGKATITAKAGKKKYICHITVRKMDNAYRTLLDETAQALVRGDYKKLMELAPEDEFLSWVDSLGETTRHILVGNGYGGYDSKFWTNPANFYRCMAGREYADYAEAANQEYNVGMTGVGIRPQAKSGNYTLSTETTYERKYGADKYQRLKNAFKNTLGVDITEAKVIKCKFKDITTKTTEAITFTLIKANQHWYFAPLKDAGYFEFTSFDYLNLWRRTASNLTAEDTVFLETDKISVNPKKRTRVIITVDCGEYDGTVNFAYSVLGDGVACKWGEWLDDNRVELFIYPKSYKEYRGATVTVSNDVNGWKVMISAW